LACKVLSKTMDTTQISSDKRMYIQTFANDVVEIATLFLDDKGTVHFKIYKPDEIDALLKAENIQVVQEEKP